ncbi:DUF1707 domain-containing protein [Actinopolymorpha sp. B17G11]|uniref:DUF1707 SHOCT-like domain-containing protein n=1 Tax=unclassified Actinopolymorpha TaxID=2627063 RepID=UPI0032D991F8
MSDNLPDRSAYRAGDADREAVVERLRAAASDGRLDLAEFEERMSAAYTAKTFAELAPLTADLLDGTSVAPAPTGPAEITLHAVGSSVSRRGTWVVPRKVSVKGKAGSTMLDLTQARLLSQDVEIALDASAGSVTIVVPPGTQVDTSDLKTSFGSTHVRTDTPSEYASTAQLRLTVTGTCHMGSVTVRHLYFWEPWFRDLLTRWRRKLQAR